MITVGKRMGPEEKKASEAKQAKIALVSNVVGLTAGGAALVGAARNPALRKPGAGNIGPITGWFSRRMKTSPRDTARLARAGAAGAFGLQAANTGGDAITNIVLRRENDRVSGKKVVKMDAKAKDRKELEGKAKTLKKHTDSRRKEQEEAKRLMEAHEDAEHKMEVDRAWLELKHSHLRQSLRMPSGGAKPAEGKKPVKKSDASFVSKALGSSRSSGQGVNLEKSAAQVLPMALGRKQLMTAQRKRSLDLIERYSRDVRGTNVKGVNRGLSQIGVRKAFQPPPGLNPMQLKVRAQAAAKVKRANSIRHPDMQVTVPQPPPPFGRKWPVKKAYDPEADRQRRMGLYAGAGMAGSGTLGYLALKGVKNVPMKPTKVPDTAAGRLHAGRTLAWPKGSGRKRLLLGAGSLAAGVGGAAAYRHGTSVHNVPWE